ncbi:tRNA (adenosine(37)-N6)-dimethylallyltransferase MiaA [Sphingomonas sp. NSE70-1]|uniref:tRNA dimethylallyltransferase n=1 Tax=Sphingomonas caseinilyticus TaxID=2908205 RepID=A0ABT0RR47_9SPHN|nr:tRNA (adenosine(37)-N6)-dimethylallyltransferase MiaA [Sphingomonas caseinilyticus]MCL6697394.1 tRNA (adenosine(37)-N6)-dimethylallyltransferase MiaA [Sphingomonas caseinilyticus]
MTKVEKPPVALIAGPTASGKSALALRLAEISSGAVLNADSAQVYRDLPILSAAPTAEDRARAEHCLYGVLDGAESCSAADWAESAKSEIARLHAEGRLPVLVGGTGLYLRTLLDGIAPIPEIDPQIRADVRAAGVAENLAALTPLDPVAAATLNPGDTTRIARALEVVRSTGKTLNSWQEECEGGIADTIDIKALVLTSPRPWLYERCDVRFAQMVERGALEEVETLLARGLNPDLPVMRAIGVAELGTYLRGERTLEDATAAGAQATRRYAKRQYTWFAHQPPPEWPRFHEPLEGETIERALAMFAPAG